MLFRSRLNGVLGRHATLSRFLDQSAGDALVKGPGLFRRQVFLVVLGVGKDQIDHIGRRSPVVDNAGSATLAPARHGPSQLSEAARSRYQRAGVRAFDQHGLKAPQVFICPVFTAKGLEGCEFNEDHIGIEPIRLQRRKQRHKLRFLVHVGEIRPAQCLAPAGGEDFGFTM